jgi:DNA-binding FadR family transcriptional regulator
MPDNLKKTVPPWDLDVASHPFVKQQVKEIAARIFDRIGSGQYQFGTRIPAERELAADFTASRATVRQALDFLETYGIVARRPGSGTFIAYRPEPVSVATSKVATELPGHLNIQAITESASPFEMNVAESILEPEMVRLATIYMSTRDLAKLSAILEKLQAIVTEAEEFADLENEFMTTISEGTHNSLIVAMYKILNEVRRQPQWRASRMQILTPKRIRDSQHRLRSLYNALDRRNVESAVEFMRLHIASSQEDMIYAS